MHKKILALLVVAGLAMLAWRGSHADSQPSAASPSTASTAQSVAPPSVTATDTESSVPSSSAVDGTDPSSPVTSVQGPPPPSDNGADEDSQAISTDQPPAWPHSSNPKQQQLWKQATACAEGFMKAAAEGRRVSESQWWSRVKPFLSDQAQKSWQGYGSRVPFSKVISQGVPMPLDGTPASEDLPVWVKTDTGVWIVHTATGPDGTKVVTVVSAEGGEQR
ncbi:hypothetical protein [Dermacoccus abyssi]